MWYFKEPLTFGWYLESHVAKVPGLQESELTRILENFKNFITVRNEVAKVMFLQVSVCPQGRCLLPLGGVWSREVSAPGGHLLPGGAWSTGVPALGDVCSEGMSDPRREGVSGPRGVVSQHALRQTPAGDSYCCRWYASYWNAFLFVIEITASLNIVTAWRAGLWHHIKMCTRFLPWISFCQICQLCRHLLMAVLLSDRTSRNNLIFDIFLGAAETSADFTSWPLH